MMLTTLKLSLISLVALAAAAGCAHPQTVALTSAQVAGPVAAPADVAPPQPAVAQKAPAVAQKAPSEQDGMTFEQLTAALGSDDGLAIASLHASEAPSAHLKDDGADRGTIAGMRQATPQERTK